jgi:hypothetical protein
LGVHTSEKAYFLLTTFELCLCLDECVDNEGHVLLHGRVISYEKKTAVSQCLVPAGARDSKLQSAELAFNDSIDFAV